jgi:hypothetical protein
MKRYAHILAPGFTPVYANDNDAYIPEVWAAESLMILTNNLIAANLVHRDFEDEVANFGDVVNTRRPNDFTMKRKNDSDSVTVQDAVSPNVAVKLDQHLHTSFMIKDGEESKGFKNLVEVYLEPAIISIAQGVDEIVTGMTYQYLANCVGQLGVDATKSSVISARDTMNQNKVPVNGRNLLISSPTEAALLNIDEFVTADKVGDEGSALREGSLGRKYGFQIFMDQNQPSIATGNTIVTGEVDNAGGYAAGATTMTVDGFVAAITNGSWFVVEGDLTPQQVVSTIGGATPTSITFTPGLKSGVVDDADITSYTPGAIDNGAGYPLGESRDLTIDGFTVAPKTGQLTTIGAAGGPKYSQLSTPTTTSMLLNRALQAAVIDDDAVGIGPAGNYNYFFHRNAMTLVSRPLAAPMAGTGALSSVANFGGIAIRITITYDGSAQGHLVTADMLLGTEVLDSCLGGVLLA